MPTAQKFIFGTDFREGGRRNVSDADLAAARAEGFLAGQEQGRREAESQLQATLGQVARSAERLLAGEAAHAQAIEGRAAHLALTTARGLAGAALALRPLALIEGAVRECLGHARHAPHLVVRIHESAVEAVEVMVQRLAREVGFAGRIVVLGELDIASGDGRIEWADGGLAIDTAQLDRLVEQTLHSVFGAAPGFATQDRDQT